MDVQTTEVAVTQVKFTPLSEKNTLTWADGGHKLIRSRAEPSRAEPSRAEPSRAEPSRAEPSRAEPSRAEPSRAEPSPLFMSAGARHALRWLSVAVLASAAVLTGLLAIGARPFRTSGRPAHKPFTARLSRGSALCALAFAS